MWIVARICGYRGIVFLDPCTFGIRSVYHLRSLNMIHPACEVLNELGPFQHAWRDSFSFYCIFQWKLLPLQNWTVWYLHWAGGWRRGCWSWSVDTLPRVSRQLLTAIRKVKDAINKLRRVFITLSFLRYVCFLYTPIRSVGKVSPSVTWYILYILWRPTSFDCAW